MNEDAIKTEMRLWALEVLVCNLIAIVCLSDRAPAELLSRTRERIVAGARTRTFPGVDAAISDLYVEAAVARLMDMVAAQMSQHPTGTAKPD
jgi:alkylation response protein AidB-like acyl-CoA dehydrogenase